MFIFYFISYINYIYIAKETIDKICYRKLNNKINYLILLICMLLILIYIDLLYFNESLDERVLMQPVMRCIDLHQMWNHYKHYSSS